MSIKNLIAFTVAVLVASTQKIAGELHTQIPHATVGYMIIDLKTNSCIAEYNADKCMIPASTMKVITAAAALDKFGADFRYRTDVLASGPLKADTIYGDLIIRGSGDPSLDEELACSIKDCGVRHIAGTLKLEPYGDPYINPNWMVEDVGSDYGTGWAPLNFRHNEILINDHNIAVNSEAIISDIVFTLSLNNITLGANDYSTLQHDTILLRSIFSPTLQELAEVMIKESDNLYAEALGRLLSNDFNSGHSLDSLSHYASEHGVNLETSKFKDFCGLSRTNLITPHSLAQFLANHYNDRTFINLFPKAGTEGTVKNFLRNRPDRGQFRLKSGSMDGILNYAGYRLDPTGHATHAIVIMVNNACEPTSKIKRLIEQWFLKFFY